MMTRINTHFALALAVGSAACASDVATPADAPSAVAASVSALTTNPVDLIAIGTLDGSGADRSSETSGALENGAPGNLLGGIGSGLAFAGGRTFIAVPDRGPNATPYNPAVDETTSYINRFQTLKLRLHRSESGAALPFTLTPKLKATTLLFDKQALVYGSGAEAGLGSGAPALNDKRTHYFSGRSDNFDAAQPSTNPRNGRFDPEGVRVGNDGKHVYITDEYGPYVYEFDRKSGKRARVFALPGEFAIAHSSAAGATEISGNTSGRVANKGMEGLAITPDGRTLVGAMQSPLLQDKGTDGRFLRIVAIEIASGAIEQYAYELTNIGTDAKPKYPTVSEIVAIDDHQFLVDERDGKGLGDNSTAVFKRIFRIDLSDAQEVSGISGEENLAGKAVPKTLFLDLVASFNAHGIASNDIPAKLEGLAFGPDVRVNGSLRRTLYVSNDNDFIARVVDSNHPSGIDNPNKFFVFAIDPSTLPAFAAQALAADEEDEDDD
jgi:hypothetical protein